MVADQTSATEAHTPSSSNDAHVLSLFRDKERLTCPVFEADIIVRREHTCSGTTATVCSQIRTHLIKGKSPHVQFLKLCGTCNEDILDEEEFEQHHGSRCNTQKSQRRKGDHVLQWIALYRKLNPGVALPERYQSFLGSSDAPCPAEVLVQNQIQSPPRLTSTSTTSADSQSHLSAFHPNHLVGSLHPPPDTSDPFLNNVGSWNAEHLTHSYEEEISEPRPVYKFGPWSTENIRSSNTEEEPDQRAFGQLCVLDFSSEVGQSCTSSSSRTSPILAPTAGAANYGSFLSPENVS